jgi:hypothetical protein
VEKCKNNNNNNNKSNKNFSQERELENMQEELFCRERIENMQEEEELFAVFFF